MGADCWPRTLDARRNYAVALMPFFLLAVGLTMLAAVINGKSKELGDLIQSIFSGPGSFINIAIVLLLLGAAGAITGLKPLATAFMGLVLLVLFLGNAGTTTSVNILTTLRKDVGGS